MTPVAELPETGGTFSPEFISGLVPLVAIGAIALLTYAGLEMVVTGNKPFGNKNL